nr:hypothetical protein [Streptosporangium carneum]
MTSVVALGDLEHGEAEAAPHADDPDTVLDDSGDLPAGEVLPVDLGFPDGVGSAVAIRAQPDAFGRFETADVPA